MHSLWLYDVYLAAVQAFFSLLVPLIQTEPISVVLVEVMMERRWSPTKNLGLQSLEKPKSCANEMGIHRKAHHGRVDVARRAAGG